MLHFSSLFFIFASFFFIFLHFLHFSTLWRKIKKSGEKWLQNQDFFPCAIWVCVYQASEKFLFCSHISPPFSGFLRFSHFLQFSSWGNTTGRGNTAGNEKCPIYEFMKLKLEKCHCVTYSILNHVVSCNKLCSESVSTQSLVQNLCFANFRNSFLTKKTWKKMFKYHCKPLQ